MAASVSVNVRVFLCIGHLTFFLHMVDGSDVNGSGVLLSTVSAKRILFFPLLSSSFVCFVLFVTENFVSFLVVQADSTWQDAFGHDCKWFYEKFSLYPDLCLLQSARTQCPVSCRAKQECYSQRVWKQARFAWDRTRLIKMRSPNGTVCLSSDLDKATVVQQCERWLASEEAGASAGRGVSAADDKLLEGWLESMSASAGAYGLEIGRAHV